MKNELIVFLEDLKKNYIVENADNQSIDLFLKRLENQIAVFYRSKETVFYHKEDIKKFCSYFSYDETYFLSLQEKLYEILKNARAYDYSTPPTHHTRYYRWDYCSEEVKRLENNVLAEITERQSRKEPNKHFVLLVPSHAHPYTCKKFITTFKDNNEEVPYFERIDYVVDVTSAEEWLKKKRFPRKMNKNPKHGENGKDAHITNKGNKVSLLLCSIAEAQTLLDDAFEDKNLDEKKVFNYDVEKKAFIVFFCEGLFEAEIPYYQYHGFHLDDINDVKRMIPSEIQQILRKKYNL